MNDTELAAAFDATAGEYDADPHHRRVAEALVAGIDPAVPASVVIDVATGTGFAAHAALRALRPDRIEAIDLSAGMIEAARAKAGVLDPEGVITWRCGQANPLPLEPSSADLVLCASSLHFLGVTALRDWLRVLRPGGLAAFSLPHAAHFRPSPEFRRMMPAEVDELAQPNERAAVRLATTAGFTAARASVFSGSGQRARPAFLVWAERGR